MLRKINDKSIIVESGNRFGIKHAKEGLKYKKNTYFEKIEKKVWIEKYFSVVLSAL